MEIIEAKNILAHRILFRGESYSMSIANISDDRSSVSITPFVKEEPGTVFVSGTIELMSIEGKIKAIHHLVE